MNKLGKTKFLSLLSLIFVMCSCTAKTERHVHSFDKQWSFDSINHYHACTKEACDKKSSLEVHDFIEEEDYKYCKVCGYREGGDSCVHKWSEWEITEESTCREKGARTRYCLLCGKEEVKSMPIDTMYGHKYVENEDADYAPTCSTTGITGSKICLLCGQKVKGQVIPPIPHSFNSSDPSDSSVTKNYCNICGYTEFSLDITKASGWNNPNEKMNAKTGENSMSTWNVFGYISDGVYDIKIVAKLNSASFENIKWYNMAKESLCPSGEAEDPSNRFDSIDDDDYRYYFKINDTIVNPNVTTSWGDLGLNNAEYNPAFIVTDVNLYDIRTIALVHGNNPCALLIKEIILVKK